MAGVRAKESGEDADRGGLARAIRPEQAKFQPALNDVDAALAMSIAARFGEVQAALDEQRSGEGFVPFTAVTAAQVKALAQSVDALAEPLSQVAAKLVGS
jgi:iron uptake system EfeUOB component EfeO/EfeM